MIGRNADSDVIQGNQEYAAKYIEKNELKKLEYLYQHCFQSS